MHGVVGHDVVRNIRSCLPGNVIYISRGQRCIFIKSTRRAICGSRAASFVNEANFICDSGENLSCDNILSELTNHVETTETTETTTKAQRSSPSVSVCPPCLPCTQAPVLSTSSTRRPNYRRYNWIEILKR